MDVRGLRGRPGCGHGDARAVQPRALAVRTWRREHVQPLLVPIAEAAGTLLLGACGSPAGTHLNGKLEAPMLLAGAAAPDQMMALAAGVPTR